MFGVDDLGVICGLWLADPVWVGLGKMGDGRGWKFEPFAVPTSASDCTGSCVSNDGSSGLEKLIDSGSSKLSICSEPLCSGLLPSADLLFGEILNRDAGVAGDGFPARAPGNGKGTTFSFV